MKHSKFINRLKKQLGKDVTIQTDSPANEERREWCFYKDELLSWRVHRPSEFRGETEDEMHVGGFHSRSQDAIPDSQTDYFPGTYWDNAKQLLDSACPPPPKYTPGSLVRGKPDNKRGKRMGYAGKLAIVTSGGNGYFQAKFVTEASRPALARAFNPSYPERDFELVSGPNSGK